MRLRCPYRHCRNHPRRPPLPSDLYRLSSAVAGILKHASDLHGQHRVLLLRSTNPQVILDARPTGLHCSKLNQNCLIALDLDK
jgi:hypothetical protein